MTFHVPVFRFKCAEHMEGQESRRKNASMSPDPCHGKFFHSNLCQGKFFDSNPPEYKIFSIPTPVNENSSKPAFVSLREEPILKPKAPWSKSCIGALYKCRALQCPEH